jgi:putative ABC transport system permease protein
MMGSRAHATAFTIIGVMPPEFDYPRGAAAWMPLPANLARASKESGFDLLEARGVGILYVVGRLKPGVALSAARAEMDGIVRRLTRGDSGSERSSVLTPLPEYVFGQTRPTLMLLLAAAFLVLTLTCANVIGLLLARLSAERRRIAVQIALGAERSHLLRQSIGEGAALTTCGLAGAAALAYWSVPLLISIAPDDVPRISDVTLNSTTIAAFTLGIGVVTAMVCGAAPLVALLQWRDPNLLRPGATARPSTLAARNTLVAIQTALAVVVLVAAVVTIRSFDRVQRLDFGFTPSDLITFNVRPPADKYPRTEVNARFYRPAIDRVRALPGVAGVVALSLRPFEFGPIGSGVSVIVEGQAPDDRGTRPALNSQVVTPDYFRLLQVRLVGGRTFTDQDTVEARPVVIVSDSAARALWPGQDPIGKRVRTNYDNPRGLWQTVVGVVGDVRYLSLTGPERTLYKPYLQSQDSVPHFVIEPDGTAAVSIQSVRATVRNVDPHADVDGITPMRDIVDHQTAPWRFTALLFSLLAALALAVAVTGLYALLAYQVSERTREIGIRLALGAGKAQIARFIASDALPAIGVGVGVGLATALASTRAMHGLVFGAAPSNALTYGAVCVVLLTAAAAGAYFPVRRAASVDPLTALKEE